MVRARPDVVKSGNREQEGGNYKADCHRDVVHLYQFAELSPAKSRGELLRPLFIKSRARPNLE